MLSLKKRIFVFIFLNAIIKMFFKYIAFQIIHYLHILKHTEGHFMQAGNLGSQCYKSPERQVKKI